MRELFGRYPYLVAVHAFVYNQVGELLLLKRANTGYMDNWWSVPAGHVEAGENVIEAMARELEEEVGLSFSPELHPAHIMHRLQPGDERVDFFFAIHEWEGTPQNCEPNKCSEILWHPHTQLPKKMIPYVVSAHQQVYEQKPFSIYYEK